MSNLELYDVMAEDMHINVRPTGHKTLDVEVFNENDERVFYENTTDIAWNSLVDFSRQVLWANDMLNLKKEIDNELQDIG